MLATLACNCKVTVRNQATASGMIGSVNSQVTGVLSVHPERVAPSRSSGNALRW
jgi:hypothetical protein